jgi:hypothetical protein
MSTNRHQRDAPFARNLRNLGGRSWWQTIVSKTGFLAVILLLAGVYAEVSRSPWLVADELTDNFEGSTDFSTGDPEADMNRRIASVLLERVLEYLAFGPPLEAKLRLRARAAGREVVEVGHYEQAGEGTGRLRMELQVPIADGKARWQQTCDGRLAWTREELAGEVRVRRVDLGRLVEMLPKDIGGKVPPRLRIGGLAEIIDRIESDFELSFSVGTIEETAMLVVKGTLKQSIQDTMAEANGGQFPDLVPRHVRVAIPHATINEPLPSRIEFLSEAGGRPISMLEIYDKTKIEKPPMDRFRFEAGGDDFTNETELYQQRFLARQPKL